MQEPKQVFSQKITKTELEELNDRMREEIESLKIQYVNACRIRNELIEKNAETGRTLKRSRE